MNSANLVSFNSTWNQLATSKYPGAPSEIPTASREESVLFITGGFRNSDLSSTELYPRLSGCSTPPLPSVRYGHTTFLTPDPNPLIATCGGYAGGHTASCLVLDQINRRWDASRMGSLTKTRYHSAVARLNYIGVFIIGGFSGGATTSEFLATGTMQWQEGPTLPLSMTAPCAVPITATRFLAIHGTHIREFDVVIAGPTSSEGWREAQRWPELKTSRNYNPGCAKVGQKVIIAGGSRTLRSTEVLDLVRRQLTPGGRMTTPREYFHVATITSGGQEKMFALAGRGSSVVNTAEEWVERSSTWKAANNLVEKKRLFGAVVVPRALICP